MSAHCKILHTIPNFPNYSFPTFGYPERTVQCGAESLIVLGPPIHLYNFRPHKSWTVHVSGIPDWATMEEIVTIFEGFGKLFSIELSVTIPQPPSPTLMRGMGMGPRSPVTPKCNGWALVTFSGYDGAQKALFAHLTRRIPGMVMPLSIYKATVNNVVFLKNLPTKTAKAEILNRINCYPGLITVSFEKNNSARMIFADLDSALLFMDVVSGGGLVIDNFTCTVEPEDKDNEDDGDE